MSAPVYDEIAEWYDGYVTEGAQHSYSAYYNLLLASFTDLVGVVKGRRVLDLACGQGIVARELARRGASVFGVDISERMLALARSYQQSEAQEVTFVLDDAQALGSLADGAFDGVTCNMALMDIPDLAATLQAVSRVLKPGGWFVFSITHPCFNTPASIWLTRPDGTVSREVSGYFEEGFWRPQNTQGVRSRVGALHRTLSAYLNSLVAASFTIERLLEPRAIDALARRSPGYTQVPVALLLRVRKGAR